MPRKSSDKKPKPVCETCIYCEELGRAEPNQKRPFGSIFFYCDNPNIDKSQSYIGRARLYPLKQDFPLKGRKRSCPL